MDRLLQDLQFAWRQFGRRPGFTLTTLVVLTLGMAVAASLFSFLEGYTLSPPAGVTRTEDLVRVRGAWSTPDYAYARRFARDEYEAQANATGTFRAVAGWQHEVLAVDRGSHMDPEWLGAAFVSDGYFKLIETRFAAGTDWSARRESGALVAVISHALRARRFASDAEAIGQTLTVAGHAVTVVGVTAAPFRGVDGTKTESIWLPDAARQQLMPGAVPSYATIARLAPGVTYAAATAAMQALATNAHDESADDPGERRMPETQVLPLATMNADPDFEREIRGMLPGLGLLAVLVLLVTGTNSSALQTGVAMTRGREIALRYSLGASRGRVLRQLLTEAGLLGVTAAVLSLALVFALVRLVQATLPPLPFELGLDGTAIGFVIAVGVATGVLVGISPALHALRAGIACTLKTGGSTSGQRHRMLSGLVVAQVLLTQPLVVMLTAFLLLLVNDLQRMEIAPHAAQVVSVRLRAAGADSARLDPTREVERLAQQLAALPRVERVVQDPRQTLWFDDYVPAGMRAEAPVNLEAQAVPAGWLEVMGNVLLSGRDFAADERLPRPDGADTAVLIGEDLAASMWPGRSPLGQRLQRADAALAGRTLQVVGVVATAPGKARRPGDAFAVYVPPPQVATEIALRVKTRGDAAASLDAIRTELRNTARGLGVMELRTLAAIEAEERRAILTGGLAFASLGLVTLLLAAVGLYAVVSFAVAQRGGEIAVRLAVGARASQVVRRVMRDGLRLTALGLVLGLPLSLAGLSLVLSSTSWMPPVPVWQVGSVALLGVATVAVLAAWLPARQAAHIGPADVLRGE